MTHSYNLRPRKQLKYIKEQINNEETVYEKTEETSMDVDVKEMTELTENLQLNNTEEQVVEKMRIMTLNDLEHDVNDDVNDLEYDPKNEVTISESDWYDELKTQPSSESDTTEQFDEYEYDLDYEINLSDNSILGKRKYIDEYVF